MYLRKYLTHLRFLNRAPNKGTYHFDLQEILLALFGLDLAGREIKELDIALILRDGLTYPKSSAFIRLISSLTDYQLKDRVSLKIYPENTTDIGGANLCIVQRTAYDKVVTAQQLVNNLRLANSRLIIDTDDAFSSIDPSHPEYEVQTSRVEALNYLLQQAEQVWVSVPKLAEIYKNLKAKVTVVPNGLDKRLWQDHDLKQASGPLKMVYMGTATHDADFEMVLPALDKLNEDHPDSFELTVIGVSSNVPSRSWIKREVQPPGIALYPNFVEWFLGLGPFDVGLAPLVDSEFNRGKSDIKSLDYLAAGIIPVVSNILPYKNQELDDFIIRVNNLQVDWVKALANLLKNPDEFRQNVKANIIPKAHKYIWSKRSSSQTAKQILGLLSKF